MLQDSPQTAGRSKEIVAFGWSGDPLDHCMHQSLSILGLPLGVFSLLAFEPGPPQRSGAPGGKLFPIPPPDSP